MENEQRFSQEQWLKIYAYLCAFPRLQTRHEETCRRFVEAVFWVLRSGAQGRLFPHGDGNWNVVYQRFADGAERGVWDTMLYYFAQDPARHALMIDSTMLRAHACAAGALKKVGRSRRASLRAIPWGGHEDPWTRRRLGQAAGFPLECRASGRLYLRDAFMTESSIRSAVSRQRI